MALYSDSEVIDLATKSRLVRNNAAQLKVLRDEIVLREHRCSDKENIRCKELSALRNEIEDWLYKYGWSEQHIAS